MKQKKTYPLTKEPCLKSCVWYGIREPEQKEGSVCELLYSIQLIQRQGLEVFTHVG